MSRNVALRCASGNSKGHRECRNWKTDSGDRSPEPASSGSRTTQGAHPRCGPDVNGTTRFPHLG